LRRAIGLPPDAPLRLSDTLDALVASQSAPAGAEVRDAAVMPDRADLREAAARVQAAHADVARLTSEGKFDVSLVGSYTRMDAGFPQSGFDESGALARVHSVFNYLAVGAMVTVPLRNRNQGDIAAAQAAATTAQASLEAAQLTARSEVAAAANRADRSQQALTLLEEAARLAKQNLNVVTQTYELGRMTAADVLAEQRRYWETERALTQALRDLYEAQAALLTARGERP